MSARSRFLKVVDATAVVRCVMGRGIIREEVWQDDPGRVVRYNLAFIHHLLCASDNGRVLGYDNAHGTHHRHACGSVEPFVYVSYELLLRRFLDEVSELRKERR